MPTDGNGAERSPRIKTFADGTKLIRVLGCPYCQRWTMTTATGPERYAYHQNHCEFRYEAMPIRYAHCSRDLGGPHGSPGILAILPENTVIQSWEPPQ